MGNELATLRSSQSCRTSAGRACSDFTLDYYALACLGRARVPLDSDAVLKLRELLPGYPFVRRAFLFEGSFGGPSRLVVGVDLQGRDGTAEPSETDYENVMRAVGKSLLGHLGDQPGKIADGAWLKGELLRSVEGQLGGTT